MGSFNRACSVSNLSIGYDDPVAFFLLAPNTMPRSSWKDDELNYREKVHRVGIGSGLLHSNCYFNPIALPIFGTYNDYGGIANIQEDSNTRALEKFFGIPIDRIVGCVTCCRSVTDTYAESFASFAKDKELMAGYGKDELRFDEEWLVRIGFEAVNLMTHYGFVHPKFPHLMIKLFDDDSGHNYKKHKAFRIFREGIEDYIYHHPGYQAKSDLQHQFYKLTGYHLNVSDENQERFEILNTLSGMFVHREIYDSLANSPVEDYFREKSVSDGPVTEEMLEEFGFFQVPEGEQRTTGLNSQFTLWRDGVHPFDVKKHWRAVDVIHQRHKEYCDLHLSYGCQETLRRKWLDLTGSDPDQTFPEPVDMKNLTEEEKEKIREAFRDLTGYNIYVGHHDDTKRTIWNLQRFVDCWKDFTGEELDISKYQAKDIHVARFEKLQKELLEFEEKKRNWEPTKTLTETRTLEEQKSSCEGYNKWVNDLLERDPETAKRLDVKVKTFVPREIGERYKIPNTPLEGSWDDPFKGGTKGFLEYYCCRAGGENWPHFEEIYRDAIIEGNEDLKKAFSTQLHFRRAMYSNNRFYFPAMNGEQHGNDEESRHLLLASLAIVDKRLKEREQ